MDERESEHEDEERPRRPRVVDKRISARRAAGESQPPPEPKQPRGEPAPPTPPVDPSADKPPPRAPSADTPGPEEPLWTPEQEDQVRRMAEEMERVPSLEWVVNFAVNLANVAGVKLQSRNLPEAQLAIDALSGLLTETTGRLADAEAPLRQTLAQLQMAYAQTASPPAGGAGPPPQ